MVVQGIFAIKKSAEVSLGEWQRLRMSASIKEMQIKTTLRFHLTPVRIAIISNTTTKQVLARMQGKRNPPYTVGGNVN
jgi:hypothetical protein